MERDRGSFHGMIWRGGGEKKKVEILGDRELRMIIIHKEEKREKMQQLLAL